MTEPVFLRYADLYDAFYADKDYAGEAEFVDATLAAHGLARGELLELGCGTGAHATHLARRGWRVHGVDLSSAMIERAQARLSPDLRDRVTFSQGDARTIQLERSFDAAAALFHVLSYQTTDKDIEALLASVRRHLHPGGLFLFDYWFGPAVLRERPQPRLKQVETDGLTLLRLAEPVESPCENVTDVRYRFWVERTGDGRVEHFAETHRMRHFFQPELRRFLAGSGFEVLTEVEWVTGRPLGFDTWSGVTLARLTA
jgi:SAM-dependent methyltransferase